MKQTLMLGIVLTALVAGCAKHPQTAAGVPLMAKVVIEYPGASPETVDDILSPLFWSRFSGIPHVQSFTCISHLGSFEAYVALDVDVDIVDVQDRLYAAIPSDKLPSGVGKPTIRFTRDGIPKVTPKQVPSVRVDLDRDKLMRLGLPLADVAKSIQNATHAAPKDARLDDPAHMRTLIIAYINGKPIRLEMSRHYKA